VPDVPRLTLTVNSCWPETSFLHRKVASCRSNSGTFTRSTPAAHGIWRTGKSPGKGHALGFSQSPPSAQNFHSWGEKHDIIAAFLPFVLLDTRQLDVDNYAMVIHSSEIKANGFRNPPSDGVTSRQDLRCLGLVTRRFLGWGKKVFQCPFLVQCHPVG
jgi:hypothetical protein